MQSQSRPLQKRQLLPIRFVFTGSAITTAVFIILLIAGISYAETSQPWPPSKIVLKKLTSNLSGGHGYSLQYVVPVPIKTFWQFKTDFTSELLLTNDELVGHRLVKTVGNNVITENRYASAPELKFLWKTTVHPQRYRLEFKLLNPADVRHDFHYGSIQLSAAGKYTWVTQVAYFNFTGATLWVNYPWYGGMKSTLTGVAEWEQNTALKYSQKCMVARRY
jgi:hypothetical protein